MSELVTTLRAKRKRVHALDGVNWEVDDDCQRAAARIEALEAELAEAHGYASRLCENYVRKFCDPVDGWALLPDLLGVLTQIDNASTVTVRFKSRAEAAEAQFQRMREALGLARAHLGANAARDAVDAALSEETAQ